MSTSPLRQELHDFYKEVWLEALNRRFKPAFIYFGAEIVFVVSLALWSGEAAFALFWTFWQGESAYYWWHTFFNLHPLKGYLFIVLTVSTIRLTAWWFIIFRGAGPLLELPLVRWFFNPSRLPRLHALAEYAIAKKKSRSFLFSVALIPGIWWLGYLALRHNVIKGGVATILIGNALKLTIFASIFFLFGEKRYDVFGVVAGAFIIVLYLPRLIEWFIPNLSSRARRPPPA